MEEFINWVLPEDSSILYCGIMTDGVWRNWDVCSTRLWSAKCSGCIEAAYLGNYLLTWRYAIHTTVCQACIITMDKTLWIQSCCVFFCMEIHYSFYYSKASISTRRCIIYPQALKLYISRKIWQIITLFWWSADSQTFYVWPMQWSIFQINSVRCCHLVDI